MNDFEFVDVDFINFCIQTESMSITVDCSVHINSTLHVFDHIKALQIKHLNIIVI